MEEGTIDKVAFPVPCSTFVFPAACSKDAFTKLLAEGNLSAAITVPIKHTSGSFVEVLATIVKRLHLSGWPSMIWGGETLPKSSFCISCEVVEAVDGGASLYGSTTQQKHVCLLVKQVIISEDIQCRLSLY